MASAIHADTPWSRLPWLVPPALALSLAALVAFERILASGYAGPPRPVEVSVLELPKPAAPPPPVVTPPAPAPPPPAAAITPPPAPPAPLPRVAVPVPKPKAPPIAPPVPPRVVAKPPHEAKRPLAKKLAPATHNPPVTTSERQRLDRLYHVGHDEAGNPVEPMRTPLRAAGSVRLPPLTKEQWAALDKIYHVGQDLGAWTVMRGPLRAAASKRLPPLTKAQWAYLDRIYHLGLSGYLDPAQIKEAERDSAAAYEATRRSVPRIEAVIKTPMAAIDFSRNPAHVAHNDMAAQAIAQPLPRLPEGLQLHGLPAVALARFHIAADGTESLELQQGTSNATLDRLLLDALKMWRFTPAYKNGAAVASTVDVQVTISVPK